MSLRVTGPGTMRLELLTRGQRTRCQKTPSRGSSASHGGRARDAVKSRHSSLCRSENVKGSQVRVSRPDG